MPHALTALYVGMNRAPQLCTGPGTQTLAQNSAIPTQQATLLDGTEAQPPSRDETCMA